MTVNYLKIKEQVRKSLLAAGAKDLTLTAAPTATDPVTGLGGSSGATKTALGLITDVDRKTFSETIIQTGDKTIVFDGYTEILQSDTWEGASIVSLVEHKPDNITTMSYIALVRS